MNEFKGSLFPATLIDQRRFSVEMAVRFFEGDSSPFGDADTKREQILKLAKEIEDFILAPNVG